MIVTTAELFKVAYGRFAVGAYNINNMEQTLGLFQGNVSSQAPFIIQISKGARSYTDKRMLEAMIRTADEIFPESVFAVLLDHGDDAVLFGERGQGEWQLLELFLGDPGDCGAPSAVFEGLYSLGKVV